MDDLDRIADVVAARIRTQLGTIQSSSEQSCIYDECKSRDHCVEKREPEVQQVVGQGATLISAAFGTDRVADLAAIIDHTLLKPEATSDDLRILCNEATKYNFASVCVNSGNVAYCRALLGSSPVKICAVVGFPLGAMATGAKAFEAREAVRNGASEIDMVMNIGALRGGNYGLVLEDVAKVVCVSRPAKVKVILETGMLSDEEKVAACIIAKLAGAHFVKTSTGFGKGGATTADISLMRRVVGSKMGVKASGGIHTQQEAEQMIEAGATRIGASASVAIVSGQSSRSNY